MNIFITGGTGLIGGLLVQTLLAQGHTITLYMRKPVGTQRKPATGISYCTSLDTLVNFDGYDAVVNLAGEPIAPGRWTDERKKRICESRWRVTQRLAMLIQASGTPPSVFLSGSAVGYYGKHQDAVLEETSLPNEDFLHSVCLEWERLATQASSPKTRVCISRTGIVLSSKGGMLAKLLPIFRTYRGAMLGSGEQYISWVHRKDMVDMLIFLLMHPDAYGAFNLTAPTPVNNKDFSQALAQALHRPCVFTIPAFAVSMAMGEAATLLLDGQRVSSQKIVDLGFRFSFPSVESALADIVKNGN